jgi:LPS sulfotransferase NodH
MSGYCSARYDWPDRGVPNSFIVIASTYRSGSSFLSSMMWQSGCFGAPWEYFNYERDMEYMQIRLQAENCDDYLIKLMKCRTSANRVFSVKAHFHHFNNILSKSRLAVGLARKSRYLYIDRKNKIQQAVSLAKAIQTNAWMSLATARRTPLFYSFDFINACHEELQAQAAGWQRWFETQGVTPFVVTYEDFVASPKAGLRGIAAHFGIAFDESAEVAVAVPEKQADALNSEWVERFRGQHA